jgi:phage-related protein (TIGR01555 family)
MARSRKPKTALARTDGYSNLATLFGISNRDPRLLSTFTATRWSQQAAEQLWRGHDIAKRAVELLPGDALRKGWETSFASEGDKGQDIAEALRAKHEALQSKRRFFDALCRKRALGGAGILIGADDGQPTELPLNEQRIRTVRFLNVLTPDELQPVRWYSNPAADKYNEPELYRITPRSMGGSGIGVLVHESRVIALRGPIVSYDALAETNGWGDSIFVSCGDVIRDFQALWDATALILKDFSVPVLKIKGLAALLSANDATELKNYVAGLDYCRSVMRTVMVDGDDDYHRETTALGGITDIQRQFALRLAASLGMPHTKLFGDSPSGMSATGESDQRNWEELVEAEQESCLRGGIEKLTRILLLSKDGPTRGMEPEDWRVSFCPLRQMTELEQAQIRKTQAETDHIYVTDGVVTPEEIAASRFGGEGYSTDTTIDLKTRQQMQAEREEPEAEPEEAPTNGYAAS